MSNFYKLRTWWPAACLLASLGCAACAPRGDCCPDRCHGCHPLRNLAAIYQGELADEVVCCGGCIGQSCQKWYERDKCPPCEPDCITCRRCWLAPFGLECEWLSRPKAGPPPVGFQPEMPPKFLPVPTQPILSPVRHDAPEPAAGDVELGYRNQLVSPGRD